MRDQSASDELLRKFFGSQPGGVELEYGKLRLRLIHYFSARRCPFPDDLADEAIERALKRIAGGADIPDLTRYCYGIAANLRSEKRKKKTEEEIVGDPAAPGGSALGRPGSEERLLLLRECLSLVSASDRQLLREYYWENRKELAKRLGLTANALRLRVFHALGRIRLGMGNRNSGAPD